MVVRRLCGGLDWALQGYNAGEDAAELTQSVPPAPKPTNAGQLRSRMHRGAVHTLHMPSS